MVVEPTRSELIPFVRPVASSAWPTRLCPNDEKVPSKSGPILPLLLPATIVLSNSTTGGKELSHGAALQIAPALPLEPSLAEGGQGQWKGGTLLPPVPPTPAQLAVKVQGTT